MLGRAVFATWALGGCGLQAAPFEPRAPRPEPPVETPPQSAPAVIATPTAPSVPEEWQVSVDVLDDDMVRAVSRRAVYEIANTHRGFLPSVAAVRECYEALQPDALESRLFCLQLDAAAWFAESAAPETWRHLDAATDNYLSDAEVAARRWRETPPFEETADAYEERAARLDMLDAALAAALRDYFAGSASSGPIEDKPWTP